MDKNKEDINRNYPKELGEISNDPINKVIANEVSKADFTIDMHEAFAYYLLNNTITQSVWSMGSTITCGNTPESKIMTEKCLIAVNKLIPKNAPKYKKFVTFPDEVLKGSFRNYVNNLGKHYILVETSGQNKIQPISVREEQQRVVALTVLREYNMI
jgi:predicted deacylase